MTEFIARVYIHLYVNISVDIELFHMVVSLIGELSNNIFLNTFTCAKSPKLGQT